MADRDALVQETLDRHVPLREAARPDWADVLRRAEIRHAENGRTPAAPAAAPSRRRPSRRLLLAAAIALVALAALPLGPALAGLGRDAFDGLGSWLRGDPGTPAPAAEQSGFSERNDASYASFPAGTELRLLARPMAGGKRFSLLGFRTEASLCLRLVRADLPGGRGVNECVTERELLRSPAPALVVSDAGFRFGEDRLFVEGVFGFADDTVAAVEVRRVRSGWSGVRVASNVFVGLSARPSGSVQDPPPYDPIVQVRALRRNGTRAPVPFVARDSAIYAQGVPRVPSYLGHGRSRDVPGPGKVDVRFPGGTIAWVEDREERGEPFSLERRIVERLGTVVFSRRIQPDPDSPMRIGVTLIRVSERSRWSRARPGELLICVSDLRALGRGPTGMGCGAPGPRGPFQGGSPLVFSSLGPEQLTELAGLAADAVAGIELYLASGRTIPGALRDNAFVVQAATAELPGKLVARDNEGRVVGIHEVPGLLRPMPCPRATIAAGAPPAPEPYERLDLATAQVDGHEIFGRRVDEVIAALGRPDRIAYFSSTNGIREPTLFYGGTRPGNVNLTVKFGLVKKRIRAVSLGYQGTGLVETRLGRVLQLQPLALQRRVRAVYGDRWKLALPYGSRPELGCAGTFSHASRSLSLHFRIDPRTGSRPSLILGRGRF